MIRLEEYNEKVKQLNIRANKVFEALGEEFIVPQSDEDIIKITLAGPYSAGKSSIIKMLTGDNSIEIGANITTQVAKEYDWNGIKIIDTPGIGTELNKEHDQISWKSIMTSNLIIYVITNELFDAKVADEFRRIAISSEKGNEMILVVNKMDKTTEGNNKFQQDVILNDETFLKVIVPYNPQELNITFLSTNNYFEYLNSDDEDVKDYYLEESGYECFAKTIDRFVKDKCLQSKLTTYLHAYEMTLNKMIDNLMPELDNNNLQALKENMIQKRNVYLQEKKNISTSIMKIIDDGVMEIRDIGLEAASLIDNCEGDLEDQLDIKSNAAKKVIDKCRVDIEQKLSENFEIIESKINEIDNQDFSVELEKNIEKIYDDLPASVKYLISKSGTFGNKMKDFINKNAFNDGIADNNYQLNNFTKGKLHDELLKIGKLIGYKFKPWQAAKYAKNIAKGAKVLEGIGVVVSAAGTIYSEYEKEKIAENIKLNKASIKEQFNNFAKSFEINGRSVIKENVEKGIDLKIAEIDESLSDIRNQEVISNESIKELNTLIKECNQLIKLIYQG